MTLPTSGVLSLTDIQTEFGGSNPIGLNEYYAGGTYVPSGTTGTNGAVPTSGQISISSFYGTSNYYTLSKSLRLRSSATAYLSRTPGSSGNKQKFTFSAWVKLGAAVSVGGDLISANNGAGGGDAIEFQSTNKIALSGSGTNFLVTTQVFRDPTAWYHIVYAVDTTQVTASDRLKLYINGIQVTSFSTTNYPAQNYSFSYFNTSGQAQLISNGYSYYDGYVTAFYFIDGQQLTPSSFGVTNSNLGGMWQPASYTGTYGTNGFWLPFTNTTSTTTLVNDSSGNGNNFTPNNISLTAGSTYDSMTDVPTLTSATTANYCVLNPIGGFLTGGVSLSNANLTYSLNRTTYNCWTAGSFQMPTTGKYYFETQPQTSSGVAPSSIVGLINSATPNNADPSTAVQRGICTNDGLKISNTTTSAYGSAYALNDIVMIAVDMDNGKIWFGKNGTWFASGDPAAGTNAAFTDIVSSGYAWFPSILFWKVNTTETGASNFGQRPFSYTPPTGFVALNTYNL